MPDSTEAFERATDVRLTRIEATEAARTDLFRQLGSLVGQYAVLCEREEKLRADLNDGLARVQTEAKDQVAALRGEQVELERQIAEMRREQEARIDRDRDRERREIARRDVEAVERAKREKIERKDRFIRNTTLITLIFAAISTTAGVITVVIG